MLPEWFLTLSAWVVAVVGLLALVLLVFWMWWKVWDHVRVLRTFSREVLRYAVERRRREAGRRTHPPIPPEAMPDPRRSLD